MFPPLTIHMIAGCRLCYNHSDIFVSFNQLQRNSAASFRNICSNFSDNEDSEFDIDTHIDEAYRSLFPQLARKFVEVASAALLACVVSGQFFSPALVKATLRDVVIFLNIKFQGTKFGRARAR